jgi:hypothetical protein
MNFDPMIIIWLMAGVALGSLRAYLYKTGRKREYNITTVIILGIVTLLVLLMVLE